MPELFTRLLSRTERGRARGVDFYISPIGSVDTESAVGCARGSGRIPSEAACIHHRVTLSGAPAPHIAQVQTAHPL